MGKKSYVAFQNEFTFKALEENKKVSHFVEIMSPFERPCFDFLRGDPAFDALVE